MQSVGSGSKSTPAQGRKSSLEVVCAKVGEDVKGVSDELAPFIKKPHINNEF